MIDVGNEDAMIAIETDIWTCSRGAPACPYKAVPESSICTALTRQTVACTMPSLRLGNIAPDFEAETTKGPIKFHEWIGDSWVRSIPCSVACYR